MNKTLIAAAALVAVSACSPTDSSGREVFVTREGTTVLHSGPSAPFEVKFRAGFGAADYWCAAGRFADNQRLSTGASIFRVTPTPRPQGSGVVFSFTPPPGGGQPTGLVTLGGPDDRLSAVGARDQCRVVNLRTQQGD